MLGAKQLVNLVRVMAFDASPGAQINDADLLMHLDAAIGFYQVRCALENRDMFLRPFDITYVANQEMYRWARFVSRVSMTERTSLDPAQPAAASSFADKFSLNYGWSRNIPQQDSFWLRNTEVGIAPTPSAAGSTLRLWASVAPPPLQYGTVAAWPEGYTATQKSTTLVLAVTPTKGNHINLNDVHNEMPILVTDSTERILEPNVVTDYVASSRLCTTAFTWATTPTEASSLYQFCPPLPEQFHPMVGFRAAVIAKISLEDQIADLATMERDFFSTFTAYISRSQDQSPKMVTRYR